MAMSMAMQRRKSGGSSIGESLDLMFGRLGIGAQGKEYKLSQKEQKAKTEHTKAVADYIREQTELMADEEVKELNRQLKSNEVILGKENIKAAKDKMALLEKLKGGTPEERELYVDTVLGGLITKREREHYNRVNELMRIQSINLRDSLAKSNAELNRTRFEYDQFRDLVDDERKEANMQANLLQGPLAEQLRVVLGDEAFTRLQEKAATGVTGLKLRKTPHDYGFWKTNENKPGDFEDFKTIYKYWENGNVLDKYMWRDWADELSEIGYYYDNASGKIKISPEDKAKITQAVINNAGRRKSVRELTNTALSELEKAKKNKEITEGKTEPQSKTTPNLVEPSPPKSPGKRIGETKEHKATGIKFAWDGSKWVRVE